MVLSPQQRSSPTLDNVLAHLKGVRPSLHGWKACCPAHVDNDPSLSIALGEQGQVLLKCFAGCSLERIVEAMGLSLMDLFPTGSVTVERATSSAEHRTPLTLLDLALEKQLPWQYLFHLGVMEQASGSIQIPYHLADGRPAPRYRIRTALVAKEGSYWNTAEGRIVPYGLERLEDARKASYLVLVEGESDCWTLWYQGFPALGLPGAEMVGILEETWLAGIDRLYVLQEPDSGGHAFVSHIGKRLADWRWQGKAFVVRLNGAKDPNELYTHDRKGFRAAFEQALEQAKPLRISSIQAAVAPPGPACENRPTIFSLPELLSWELPPVRWAVPEILPEGLTLLAGKPKLGKSWLALSLALSIAAGGVALGKQAVEQGNVLYLALEENARRLQARARQLLSSMTGVPHDLEFALDWPRLTEGGQTYLEEYLKTHPTIRLVVIDTWARIAPRSDSQRSSQYEGDYEALTPLKRLADTYHVSILVVHHLRKTGAPDVLDEITGSTGMTGAVDGMLILKRERGQMDATLFVTGRDVEREQQLALRFEMDTAQWMLLGSSEEVGRSRERQEILDLLRDQSEEGMRPREIAEALQKNYHTTRALLGKMVESGEVLRLDGRYVAFSLESDYPSGQSAAANREIDRYSQAGSARTPSLVPMINEGVKYEEAQTDYTDYTDYAHASVIDAIRNNSSAASGARGEEPGIVTRQEPSLQRQENESRLESSGKSIINGDQRNHRNQCHAADTLILAEKEVGSHQYERTGTIEEEVNLPSIRQTSRNRCPHHPRERLVRFDPTGQAWCNRLDCWDCYRLMQLGETLGYSSVTDQGDQLLIREGRDAWSAFVLRERPFIIMVATQAAIAQCQVRHLDVPDLSGEVKKLVRLPPISP